MNHPILKVSEQTTNAVAGTTLGMSILGVSIQDWASALAVVWLLWQLGWSAYGKYQDRKNKE